MVFVEIYSYKEIIAIDYGRENYLSAMITLLHVDLYHFCVKTTKTYS